MGLITLVFVAISLAMDAFTVAIAKGISLKEAKPHQAAKVALFFGGFQALMPFIGWACGQSFEKYIHAFTPWIALILLCAIGGKGIGLYLIIIKAHTIFENVFKTNDKLNNIIV